MTILVVHHRVRDFATWKRAFDEHRPVREKHGMTAHWLYHAPDDPNDVVVAGQMPSAAAAAAFVDDPGLAEVMARAGVEGRPAVHVWEEIEAVTY